MAIAVSAKGLGEYAYTFDIFFGHIVSSLSRLLHKQIFTHCFSHPSFGLSHIERQKKILFGVFRLKIKHTIKKKERIPIELQILTRCGSNKK